MPRTVRASFYGKGFAGKPTANGEIFDPAKMTAASKTLPFNTCLLVSFRDKSVIVRINDRGPYVEGRNLDLSQGAAERLGMISLGVANVQFVILQESCK